jgi:sigma-B regulation protein RsbU (phosphoserine phosphatase)
MIVTHLKLLTFKNAMLLANLAAMMIGGGLLDIIYKYILGDYQQAHYIQFHLQTAHFVGFPVFASVFAALLIYEQPIRGYLQKQAAGATISEAQRSLAARRLLNEPFVIVGLDLAAWIVAGSIFAIFEYRYGLGWAQVSMNRIDALLTGLVATTIAFFLAERILQSVLAPSMFPDGKLHAVKGTWRINLAVRMFAVFVAINLIPFLAILVSLYRITISERPAIDSLKMLTSGLWVVTPVAVAIGAGLVLILVLNLKRSLDALVVVLKQVTAGRFHTRVKVTANDEIGYVGDVINEMTTGLIERDRMRRSLDLAMEVQQQLLPKEDLKIDGIDIAGKSIYCDETGGDYYDFIKTPAGRHNNISLVIGDVSGHGIPSALLMASVRSLLRQRASIPGSAPSIISDVNRLLTGDVGDSGQFVTLFYLCIDPVKRSLEWVRAGHDPAVIYNSHTDGFEELHGPGIALGVDENWEYEANRKVGLQKGQIIFLSTDGIHESRNLQGAMFGKTPILNIIRSHAGLSAKEILDAIYTELEKFRMGAPIEDDITGIVAKID